MTNIVECKAQDFEKVVFESKILFLSFGAEWCAPCKQFNIVFEEVASKNDDIVFMHINVENAHELCELLQIQSVPHLMIFKNGIAIYSDAGNMPKSVLVELVEQSKKVDITAIQKEIYDN